MTVTRWWWAGFLWASLPARWRTSSLSSSSGGRMQEEKFWMSSTLQHCQTRPGCSSDNREVLWGITDNLHYRKMYRYYFNERFTVSFFIFPDAEHVLRHPDRVITINEQQFPIQLKRFEDMEVRGGQIRIALQCFFTHSFCTGLHYTKNLLSDPRWCPRWESWDV